MKNKLMKIAPLALIAVLGACNGGGEAPKKTTWKDTKEFIEQFEKGEKITKNDGWKIFKNNLLSTTNDKITNASIQTLDYMPYWTLREGLEESDYAENVKKLDQTETYKRYNNNVIETSIDYSKYPYDAANAGEYPATGLATDPVTFFGKGFIYYNEDEPSEECFHYTYTQGDDAESLDPTDSYSFHASGEYNKKAKSVNSPKKVSDTILSVKEDVEVSFAYYAAAWGGSDSDDTVEEVSTAERTEDGGFRLHYCGDICMRLYSAERVWGYEYDDDDDDYEFPIKKETSNYDGCYVDRRIRFEYSLELDAEGVVTSFKAYDFSYWTTRYGDTQYQPVAPTEKMQDPYFAYPLSNETIQNLKAEGRLVVADKVGDVENPYTGESFDDYLPYTAYFIESSSKDNGDFDKTNLPDASIYRKKNETDSGNAWFDANDLFPSEFL